MADDTAAAVKIEDIKKLKKFIRIQPLRYVHIFFSIILTLYGAGILLATLTVRIQLSDYKPFLHYYLDNPVLVLIIVSIILMVLGCTGIVTTVLTLKQGIVTFGVLLFGLFMFKLTMGVVFFLLLNTADLSVREALDNHVNNYTENSDSMDFIQENLNCCGKNDFSDWNSTLGYIPGSCCNSDSPCGISDVPSLNLTGCYAALKILIDYLLYYSILMLGVLAILQIATMMITIFLISGINNCRRRISHCDDNNVLNGNNIKEREITIPKIRNPMGLRGENDGDKMRKVSVDSRNNTQSLPVRGNSSNQYLHSRSQLPVANEERSKNPVYQRDNNNSFRQKNNDNNNINRNSSRKIIPYTGNGTQLPRAHRRFPIGF